MIVFDASTVISATLKCDSVPERALLHAQEADVFALSSAVDAEITEVLGRAKFARILSRERPDSILATLRATAVRFNPVEFFADCRDAKDSKHLKVALASGAESWSAATTICSCSDHGVAFESCVRRSISPLMPSRVERSSPPTVPRQARRIDILTFAFANATRP